MNLPTIISNEENKNQLQSNPDKAHQVAQKNINQVTLKRYYKFRKYKKYINNQKSL